jgi:hypothetical protein
MQSIESLQKQVNVSYPRTGKRGVPQQFARRLYEMLQSEAKLALVSPPQNKVYITWSESGLAFRIHDIDGFTANVLPKYFRTKKFSSFQRNLNLYGFSKVRRGPDTDMYAHPSFVRGKPELLTRLRKCASAASRRNQSSESSLAILPFMMVIDESCCDSSTSAGSAASNEESNISPISPPRTIVEQHPSISFRPPGFQYPSPIMPRTTCHPQVTSGSVSPCGIGRLDLLALAVEHAA